MNVVVDASVAVKWFLRGSPDEQHTDLALRLLEQTVQGLVSMVQPDHFGPKWPQFWPDSIPWMRRMT